MQSCGTPSVTKITRGILDPCFLRVYARMTTPGMYDGRVTRVAQARFSSIVSRSIGCSSLSFSTTWGFIPSPDDLIAVNGQCKMYSRMARVLGDDRKMHGINDEIEILTTSIGAGGKRNGQASNEPATFFSSNRMYQTLSNSVKG